MLMANRDSNSVDSVGTRVHRATRGSRGVQEERDTQHPSRSALANPRWTTMDKTRTGEGEEGGGRRGRSVRGREGREGEGRDGEGGPCQALGTNATRQLHKQTGALRVTHTKEGGEGCVLIGLGYCKYGTPQNGHVGKL